MYNRWYDENPTLGLAISLLRNTKDEVRGNCAQYVIERAQSKGITIKNNLVEFLEFSLKRWYDSDKDLTEAMEYLRHASMDQQKDIALEIIDFLQKK